MKDNLNNEITLGDYVLCLSGKHKYQIKVVTGFRVIHDILSDDDAVNFDGKDWLTAVNVISLNALGVLNHCSNVQETGHQDILGHSLTVGDTVLYLHPMEMYAEKGIVQKLSAKSCLLSIPLNRFGQTEYRKKYTEVLSLTAIGKEHITISHSINSLE